MDRDDPKRPPGEDENFADDPGAAAPTGAAEADYGADQTFGAEGNWQEEPVDDFEGDAEVHEAIYEDELADPTEKTLKEDEQAAHVEEAAEEEYYQQLPEEEKAAIKAEARSKKAMSNFGEKTFIKRYMPYIGGGLVLVFLGFFGFQQFSDSFKEKPGPMQFPKMAKEKANPNGDELVENPDNERNRALVQSEHKDMAYAEPEALAPAGPADAPAPEKIDTTPPKPLGPDIITPVTGSALPVQPPEPVPPALESQISALNAQLQDIKNSQQQLKQELENKAAEQTAASSKALEERMAQIEERISTVTAVKPAQAPAPARRPAPTSDTPAAADDGATLLPPPQQEKKEEAKPAQRKQAKQPREAREEKEPSTLREPRRAKGKGKTRSTDFMASQLQREMSSAGGVSNSPSGEPPSSVKPAYNPPRPVPPPPPHDGAWVLRSAQPGAAWISEGMSTRLRRVVPGDKVPGLGTIISVHQFAGRWVIEGTQGSVR